MVDNPDDRGVAVAAIGPRDAAKILFVSRFRHHQQSNGKNDKGDIRILAVTTHRLFFVSSSKTPKVEFSFHILEVISLEGVRSMSTTLNDTFLFQLAMTAQVGEKQIQHRLLFENEEHVGTVISFVISLLRTTFVNANVEKQVSWKLSPEARQKAVEEKISSLSRAIGEESEGCGSFAQAYQCMCDYYKQSPDLMEEVCWDINKIYASHGCKAFNLDDFDRLDVKDLVPLVATLAYNTWFTSLVVTSLKLTNELIDVIGRVMKRTLSIEEFVLQECHLNKEQMQKISVSLSLNDNKVVKRLDFSRNQLEDKGVGSLCGTLSTFPHGVQAIILNDVGMTSKGTTTLVNCLKQSKEMNTTLQKLDLSGNVIKQEGIQSLCDVFSQPNVLTDLCLSNTECPCDLLFTALHRGCQLYLENLDLSGNLFFGKKKDVSSSLSSLQQFFSMSRALKSVNFSTTKIPSSGVKAVLMGLLNNPTLTDIALDLSSNDLRSQGAEEFRSCIEDISLSSLNLSNNSLEGDLIPLCEALQNNRAIKALDMSCNVNKAKNIKAIADAMSDVLEAETLLKHVSFADNKLRHHTGLLFDALGTNDQLESLDIRGNLMGDEGARMLAKALQINTKLQEIMLDRNNITAKGLHDIAQAMERNFSLHSVPLPLTDLTAAIKANTSPSFLKSYGVVENALQRNQSSEHSTPEQAYKVHRGLLVSSTGQYTRQMDEYVIRLQNTIAKVKVSGNDAVQAEVGVAVTLLKEVESFEQVVSELFSDPEQSNNLLDDMFDKVTGDIVNSVQGVVKDTIDKMLRSAVSLCPTALNKPSELETIKTELSKNDTLLEKSSISDAIMKFGRNDITMKLCECNLNTASTIAEQLKNLFVVALTNSNDTLTTLFAQQQQPQELLLEEEPEPEVNGNHGNMEEDESDTSAEAVTMVTPQVSVEAPKENVATLDSPLDFSRARSLKRGAMASLSSDVAEDKGLLLSPVEDAGRRYTDTFADKKRKKKTCSLKRRPTFYRDSQDLQDVDMEVDIGERKSSLLSMKERSSIDEVTSPSPHPGNAFLTELTNKTTERSKSIDEGEGDDAVSERTDSFHSTASVVVEDVEDGGSVERSESFSRSVDAFDDISKQSQQLNIIKKSAKPKGRRAPKKVGKLAHMNVAQDTSQDNELKPLAKPQRPVSEFIPSSNPMFDEPAMRQRVGTEKLKREPPARPSPPTPTSKQETPSRPEAPSRPERPKKPSEPSTPTSPAPAPAPKEKKVKPPTGAFQLPALPNIGGILKKRPAPKAPDAPQENTSKVEEGEVEVKQRDEVGGGAGSGEPNTEASPSTSVLDTPPTKPPPPSTGSLKRSNSPNPPPDAGVSDNAAAAVSAKPPESTGSTGEPPPVKPSPVKKPPRGIPMGGGLGGSALMAEMNKKLHITPKTEVEETAAAAPAEHATPPTAATKPPAPIPQKPPKPQPQPPQAKETPPKPPVKPSPPQRPPSLKRETRPNVPDRPKAMTRPSKDVIDGVEKTGAASTTDEPEKKVECSDEMHTLDTNGEKNPEDKRVEVKEGDADKESVTSHL